MKDDGTYAVAIGNAKYLSNVAIPERHNGKIVSEIAAGGFYIDGSSVLKSITIPNGVTVIGPRAFYGCKLLEEVTFGRSVKTISESAFEGCQNLSSITIGESLESVGAFAFYNCTKLTDIYYGGSESKWGEISIASNSALGKVTVHYDTVIDEEDPPAGSEDTDPEEPQITYGSEVGNTAYSVKLSEIVGEGELSVEDLRGKIVVINFWSTSNSPGKSALAYFEQVASEYESSVSFYVVHSVENSDGAADFVSSNFHETVMNWVCDEEIDTAGSYYEMMGGTGVYPRTVILDENGVVLYACDAVLSESDLIAEIESALEE